MNSNLQSRAVLLTLSLAWFVACDGQLTTPRYQSSDRASPHTAAPLSSGARQLASASTGYGIELVAVDSTTREYAQTFLDATAIWAEILRNTELRDVLIPPGPKHDCHGINIDTLAGVVDDLAIVAWVRAIDGDGGALAAAGPCFLRRENSLPFMGALFLDRDDIDDFEDDDLEDLLVHEIGHILGIGPLWDDFGLLQSPSLNSPGADTHFSGPLAIAAFDAAGGENYRHNKVPVENQMGTGSSDLHWRQSVFDSELIAPVFRQGESHPLSAITIESLADLGYTVDAQLADAFTLPDANRGTAPAHAARGRAINLAGDVLTGPLLAFDAEGNVVRVRRE